jgi:cell division protein FtsZ
LLDDVSMRGARGLLISISGGPDLTLYEVDEAATRIREEVDPEANIILGATFDDTLEGTMRVSVVATGLTQEPFSSEVRETQELKPVEQPSRQVFGFTGKQPEPAKVVRPAPMVARAAPAQTPQAAQLMRMAEEDAEEAAEPVYQTQPAVAQRVVPPPPAPKIPDIEEFPPIAQRQVAAQQNRIESIADHAAKRRKGIFERLATVGIGRRSEPAVEQREPQIAAKPEPRVAAPASPVVPAAQDDLDDDQLAIPAFLRRQAN